MKGVLAILFLTFLLVLCTSKTIDTRNKKLDIKARLKAHRSKSKGITCSVNFSGLRVDICNSLQSLDQNANGVLGFLAIDSLDGANGQWCSYENDDTTITLKIFVATTFPDSYQQADQDKFNNLIVSSLTSYIGGRTIQGHTVNVQVLVNDVNFLGFRRSAITYRVQDDSSTITEIQHAVARVSSFNLEFLLGAGIFTYLPLAKLNDASQEADLKQTIAHELGHSIMSLRSIPFSMTHKGSSTVGQEALPNLPADGDICTYNPANSDGKKFLDSDIM